MKFAKSLVVASSALLASGAALAQDAVQWRVEDGGNGHWYQLRISSSQITAPQAHSTASGEGGYLATLTTQSEHEWVGAYVSAFPAGWSGGTTQGFGPLLGGVQQAGSSRQEGWRWVTGEPWSFTKWGVGEPNDAGNCSPGTGDEAYLAFITSTAWNDVQSDRLCYYGWLVPSYLIEWSSDCNSDGLVDYGQIRAGELEDTNANNIPDCCEQAVPCDPCAADVDESGVVSGVDLAAVLGAWGTSGGKYPRADINGDGVVDGADLAAVLNGWGPCP